MLTQPRGDLSDAVERWLAEQAVSSEPSGTEKFATSEALQSSRVEWQRDVLAAGFLGREVPIELGGLGGTLRDQAEINTALLDAGTPAMADPIGLTLVVPCLLRHGPEELTRRFVPQILRAEAPWCQGFSESHAGSDLASLSTVGTKVDGGWSVTGHKWWSSCAHHAKWCMLLAKTGEHGGRDALTMFAVDMERPGVTVRPIENLAGRAEFNEIVFEDVWVDDDDVFDAPGRGWAVAMTVLAHERSTGLLSHFGALPMVELAEMGSSHLSDEDILTAAADCLAVRLLSLHAVEEVSNTGDPGPAGPLTKWLWSETLQSIAQMGWDQSQGVGDDVDRWHYLIARARSASIEGGTSDVLASVVAERVLSLPRSR